MITSVLVFVKFVVIVIFFVVAALIVVVIVVVGERLINFAWCRWCPTGMVFVEEILVFFSSSRRKHHLTYTSVVGIN